MCNNGVIVRLAQNAHEAQTVGSPGDSHDNRCLVAESALISKNGLDVFKHEIL